MKVHLVKKQTIEDYVVDNARSKTSFNNWLSIINSANWNEPKDMTNTFSNADILGNGSERIVFNIGGNNYRIICKYHFGKSTIHLFIKWIGTRAEYTKLCKEGQQFSIIAF
jgi:mRNA interferase HigB